VSASEGILTAVASDRYRLIYGEITLEGEGEGESAGDLNAINIPLADIKRITAAIKAVPKRELEKSTISLNRAGDILTVSVNAGFFGTSLSIQLEAGQKFPPFKHLFEGEAAPVTELRLDAAYLASFDKVPTNGGGQLITFTGDKKPIKIKINHDKINWHGLLMPMRTN
jgi:hypothetical protein